MQNIKLMKLLRTLRMQAGISQTDMATKLGITKQSLSLMESGKRKLTLAKAKALADALGHELVIEVLPKEAAVPLSLFRELGRLSPDDQLYLAELAAELPGLEPHQREAVLELAKVFSR